MRLQGGLFKSQMLIAFVTFPSFVILAYFALSSRTIIIPESPTTCICKVLNSQPDELGDLNTVSEKSGNLAEKQESTNLQALSAIVGNSEDNLIPYKEPKPPVTVIYRDLSNCPRPRYLAEYTARCWGKCNVDKVCHQPVTNTDITKGRAKLRCFEDFHLIGVRKCGSTDLSHWFLNTKDLLNKFGQRGHRSGDCFSNHKMCPLEYFEALYEDPYRRRLGMDPDNVSISNITKLYHYGPGSLLGSSIQSKNDSHIIVSTGAQYLGFMAKPSTRYHIQIRNPTDRAISYLFHWHKGGLIFKDISHEAFSAEFTEYLLLGLLKEMEDCIFKYGELGCLYQSEGHDGHLPNLLKHSLYVIYIEEAMRFISKDQIIVTTMEEYSTSEVDTIDKVYKHFGLPFQHSAAGKEAENVLNKGKKNPVSDDVMKALDDFFAPYNQRLAKLMDDDKFLFRRE